MIMYALLVGCLVFGLSAVAYGVALILLPGPFDGEEE